MTQKILNGPIYKTLISMTIPIMLANILQTCYQLIDTFWVGRLGASAVAAVSLSFPISFFLIAVGVGLAMAGSILVAQYNGQGNRVKVDMASSQTLFLVTLFSVVIAVVGYNLAEFLLKFLTQDPAVFNQAVAYLRITFLGMPFIFIYHVFQANLRGVGSVKIPMYIISFTVIINFFIDPLLMYGWWIIPALGVAGVAWASFITEGLAALIGLVILISGRAGVSIKLKDLLPRREWVSKIFRLGLPTSLEHSSRSLESIFMIIIVASLGTFAVASYGLGMQIFSFVIIPAITFSISVSILVGNNLGANQAARATEFASAGMKISFSFLTLVGIIFFIFAKQITTIFIPNEPAVIQATTAFIRFMALGYGLIGIQMSISGVLRAAGRTKITMLLTMFHAISLIIIAYSLVKIFNLGINGIWLAYPLTIFISWIVAYIVYKKVDWHHEKLI